MQYNKSQQENVIIITLEFDVFNRYLEDLALATGYMNEIKLIEGLIVAAETLGGEVIFFSLSGITFHFHTVYFLFT